MRDECPICGRLLVMPSGPDDSPVLVFGEFPGYQEIRTGIPWSGPAGEVLQAELRRAGIPYSKCRLTNLWLHESSADPAELDWHINQLLEELKGKKAVLMLGSDVAAVFLKGPVTDFSGLNVKSKMLPKSVKVAVPCRNPAFVLSPGGMLGEVRLALEKFASLTRRYFDEPGATDRKVRGKGKAARKETHKGRGDGSRTG